MVAPVVALLGRVAFQYAAKHYAKKLVIGGAKALMSGSRDDAPETPKETSRSARATYDIGHSLGSKVAKFGAVAGLTAGGIALAKSERGQQLISGAQAFFDKHFPGSPLEAVKDKALMAAAHRINAEGLFSDPNVSAQFKKMGEAASDFANGSLMATLKGLGDKLNPADLKKYMALGATLTAPIGVKAIDTIKDTAFVEEAKAMAAAILKGEAPGYVSVRPGANAVAPKAPEQQMQHDRMTG